MRSNKPTLALLHGWGMNGRVFDALAARLADDFELRVILLPGHGGEAALATNTLESWAGCVAAKLPQDAILLGWSLGGQVAMRIALDYPDAISGLILLATTPKFVAADDWQTGIPAAELQTFGADLVADARATLLRFLSLQTRGVPAQKSLLADLREAFLAVPMAQSQALTGGLDLLLNTDLRNEATNIRHRVRVIHGGRDQLTPVSAGHWLAEHIPHADCAVIDAAAHAPFLSHTNDVASAIRGFVHGR